MLTRFLIPGLALLLTVGLGVWLSQMGKPYNGLLFNVHKLVALGAVVAGGVAASRLLRGVEMAALLPALTPLVLAGAVLVVLALFASGALMSMGKLDYVLTLTTHRAAALALVAVLAAAGYWLEVAR